MFIENNWNAFISFLENDMGIPVNECEDYAKELMEELGKTNG